MSQAEQQNLGKEAGHDFRIHRGALYAQRPTNGLRAPRRHTPPDPAFSRRVQRCVALWKANGGDGGYPTRAIANTAHGIQHPLRHIDREMQAAIGADVPLERVLDVGRLLMDRARELWARKWKRKPAA